jgi:NitT/TauT family transport system ATP-binding protein
MAEPLIKIDHVNKTYQGVSGDVEALKDVNLNIDENEFIAIVGPSGCGKTTLLNILAGLETYDSGSVTMQGQPIVGPGIDRGVIFQQYALFPWLTVRKNMQFGLKYRNYSKEKQEQITNHYMEMVGLTEFANLYPKELSGGMKQRVAIARGYATSPTVLLMDEPFGALDAQTRAQLQEDLLRTWETERKTIFFITHDVEEAVLLAQRVVMMSARPGRVKQTVKVDLPYPRNQETKILPRFNEIKNHIWANVYQEYLSVKK